MQRSIFIIIGDTLISTSYVIKRYTRQKNGQGISGKIGIFH